MDILTPAAGTLVFVGVAWVIWLSDDLPALARLCFIGAIVLGVISMWT